MSSFQTGLLRRITISILAAFAGGGLCFFLLSGALIAYAELRYPHPGSMMGLWAFVTSFPFAVAAAIVSFIVFFTKLRPKT